MKRPDMTDIPFSPRVRSVPSTRLARLGHMGGLATGLAGDLALGAGRALARGERPRLDQLILSPGSVERITDRLSQMRGAAMKLGQLMSMETGDLLPPELSNILARLRAEAHTMPPKQLKTVLEANYGTDFRRLFKGFDTQPLAAASIGQVHRATAADGTALAIKIQYPGVREAIDSDLDNAAALIRWSGMVPAALDLGPLMAEARLQLHEEADYTREGACMARFAALLEGDDRFVVPRYRPDLSAGGALAMSYEPSAPIETLADAPADTRDRAVSALIELCLRELFDFGLMQTDPNFANYRWRPETGQIVLLDFGATREIGDRLAQGHLDLMRAGLARDSDNVLAALEGLGFVRPGLAERHRTAILDMAEMGFAALDGPLDFATDDLPDRMRRRGMEIGSERELWHIPPAETLFLQRKIGGLYLLAARLGATVDFPRLLARWA
jgi:predicted unusual protein kinase regulating ubiquinone biosynthesis (AarF/ABC1/UbiB family)